jgi:hypothetical protein
VLDRLSRNARARLISATSAGAVNAVAVRRPEGDRQARAKLRTEAVAAGVPISCATIHGWRA